MNPCTNTGGGGGGGFTLSTNGILALYMTHYAKQFPFM